MVDANITGISEAELAKFRTKLRKFTEKKTKQLQDMTKTAAYNITLNAKRTVPRQFSNIHNTIRPIFSRNALSAKIGTSANYAAYVEFGTITKVSVPEELTQFALQFKGKGKYKTGGMKARPFLYPAFKAERTKYVQALKTLMARP